MPHSSTQLNHATDWVHHLHQSEEFVWDENAVYCMSCRLVMVSVSRIDEATREFDIEFWHRLGTDAIFKAAWELVVDAHIHKEGKKSELRLQRTVTNISKMDFIAKDDLIRNKQAVGRPQDKVDIHALAIKYKTKKKARRGRTD